MDDSNTPEPFVGAFFKIVFGLVLLVLIITQTPLGGAFKSASAGVYTSTISLLRTNTGGLTLDDGLVGHWTFDGDYMDLSDSTGEILDRSGNGNDGDWKNHATTTVIGKTGQAIEFDGDDDFIEMGTITTGNDLQLSSDIHTIGAWFYQKEGGDSFQRIIDKSDGADGANGWSLYAHPTTQRIYFVSAGNSCSINADYAFNEWNHIVVTQSGAGVGSSVLRLYVNGVQNTDYFSCSNTFDIPSVETSMRIGSWNHFTGREWNGYLDDIRVYDRTLSDSEVSNLYELGIPNKIAATVPSVGTLSDGLVGHYTFDGNDMDLSSSTGEVVDRSGNGNTGNWTNHSTTTVVGVIGQAIGFDGVDDWVNLGDINAFELTTSFTVAGWINTDTLSNTQTMLSKGCGAPNGYDFGFSPSSDRARFRANSVTETGNTVLKANTWYHLMFSIDDSGGLSIYVNGELDNTPASVTVVTNTSAEVEIGSCNESTWFSGGIDDVRFYDRTLSADEAQKLYTLGAPNKISDTATPVGVFANGLVGHWTFDGPYMDLSDSSAEVLDKSGNDNSGDWINHSTTTTIGKIGQAVEFDGVDDYINLGSPAEIDNVMDGGGSISVWINPSSWGDASLGQIYQKGTLFSGHSLITDNDGTGNDETVRFTTAFLDGGVNYGRWEAPDNSISLNEWQHVLVTYDADSASNDPTIYINGVAAAVSETTTPTGSRVTDAVGDGWIGDANSLTRSYEGKMDDLRVYDRILTADEARRLYEQGK